MEKRVSQFIFLLRLKFYNRFFITFVENKKKIALLNLRVP